MPSLGPLVVLELWWTHTHTYHCHKLPWFFKTSTNIIYNFQHKKEKNRRKSVLVVEDYDTNEIGDLGSCDDEDSDDEKEKEMVGDESD